MAEPQSIGERIAARFHEVYELLAPDHGYETRSASAVPWADVPEPNRSLMIAVGEFLYRERTLLPGPNLPESWPEPRRVT